MKCPSCVNALLVMSERQGVEIDYCPQCRGVWLDRGELDKLLDRAATQAPTKAAAPAVQYQSAHHQQAAYQARHHERDYASHKSHYKHKSWLAEIFD